MSFAAWGIPEHFRSDNGPEFVAKELRKRLASVGTGTRYIEPGSPWENGYCESFNGTLRAECLDAHLFGTLAEAKACIGAWRQEYNETRPHRALGERTPNEFALTLVQKPRAHHDLKLSHFSWTKISTRSGRSIPD
jgi:putative transposase